MTIRAARGAADAFCEKRVEIERNGKRAQVTWPGFAYRPANYDAGREAPDELASAAVIRNDSPALT
jgi:hypothetical protein